MTREEAERLLELSRGADLAGTDDRDRLEAAVRFFAENGQEESAAELAANVWRLWHLAGDVAGGRRMLTAALDVPEPTPSRARALALYGDGALAFRAGSQDESRARNEEALEVARSVGDREAESLALVGLSRVAFRDGDYGRVKSLASEARELARDLDAAADASPLHLLAAGTRLAGDHDAAVDLYIPRAWSSIGASAMTGWWESSGTTSAMSRSIGATSRPPSAASPSAPRYATSTTRTRRRWRISIRPLWRSREETASAQPNCSARPSRP